MLARYARSVAALQLRLRLGSASSSASMAFRAARVSRSRWAWLSILTRIALAIARGVSPAAELTFSSVTSLTKLAR